MSRDFPDGTICFDPVTAETRLLSPLTRFLLELLAQASPQSLTSACLVEQVLAVEEPGTDPRAAAKLVDAAVAELVNTGLIHPSEAV
ncbi:hypothetical protein [Roseateles sp. LYH14W]|uniref:hypothetical protein n=1 Tax=Pelomonas parva TaxID=3299032 RepID=UPI003749C5B7